MKRILAGIAAFALISTAACEQEPNAARAEKTLVMMGPTFLPVYVITEQAVRVPLAEAWDETNPQQVERAYCVFSRAGTMVSDKKTVGIIVSLDSLTKPDSISEATPVSVNTWCPGMTIPLHTHTPTTCHRIGAQRDSADIKTCVLGGDEAYECFGSEGDWSSLVFTEKDAAVIQCDRHALVVLLNPVFITKMLSQEH